MIISGKLLCQRPPCEMLLRKMLVYLIRYKADGRGYVVKTTRTLCERLKEHLRNRKNSYIDNAIRKHGGKLHCETQNKNPKRL